MNKTDTQRSSILRSRAGLQAFFLILGMGLFSFTCAAPIQSLTVENAAGHAVLQAVFHYDANKQLIGRTLYDPDGYMLRRVAIEKSGGKIVRENYLDDNGDLKRYVTRSSAGGKTSIQIFSEFNLPLFQAEYNAESPGNLFDLGPAGKLAYTYNGEGGVSNIKVTDKAGNLTHMVKAHYSSGIRQTPRLSGRIASLKKTGPARVAITFHLKENKPVTARLFDLQGKLLDVLLNKTYKTGLHTVELNAKKLTGSRVTILDIGIGDGEHAKVKLCGVAE